MAPIRRKRQIKTCEYCYRHKIKCDRKSPCSTCQRTKNKCTYHFMDTANKPVLDKKQSSGSTPIQKHARVVLDNENECTSMYYSRGFQPFLEPTLNKLLLFKMAQYAPKPDIVNYHDTGVTGQDDVFLSDFPPKKEFDDNLWYFWYAVYPLVPILDRTEFESKYNSFWEKLNSNESTFDVNYAMLLLGMLFAAKSSAELNETVKEKINLIKTEKTKIYTLFEKIKVTFGLNARSTSDFLKASVLVYYTGTFYYVGIFTVTSTLARLAEFMGLHRDPLLHHIDPHSLSLQEIDRRRFLWHFIRYLDTSTSVQSGLSPHMILINASVDFPSKNDFNTATGQFDGPLSPFRLFNIALFKASLVLETIIHSLNFDYATGEEHKAKWNSVTSVVMALYRDVGSLIKEMCLCKDHEPELIKFMKAHSTGAVHRVYLLHLSGEGNAHLYHNKVFTRPSNIRDEMTSINLETISEEFMKNVLEVHQSYPIIIVQIMIIFVYETKIRVNAPSSLKQYTWYAKNTNPMQYIFFLLKDIYGYPDRMVSLDNLPPDVENFCSYDDLKEHKGDLRKFAVDAAIESVFKYRNIWPATILDVMLFIKYLRDYVYLSVSSSTKESFQGQNSDEKKETQISPLGVLIKENLNESISTANPPTDKSSSKPAEYSTQKLSAVTTPHDQIPAQNVFIPPLYQSFPQSNINYDALKRGTGSLFEMTINSTNRPQLHLPQLHGLPHPIPSFQPHVIPPNAQIAMSQFHSSLVHLPTQGQAPGLGGSPPPNSAPQEGQYQQQQAYWYNPNIPHYY